MSGKISIPQKGMSSSTILEHLEAMKAQDIPWQSGKVLAYVYEPSSETKAVCHEAYKRYLTENGLDPTSFPSLLKLETDLIAMAADLLGGDEETVGNFTSGGTESIMLAVKIARDYFRDKKPEIKEPEMIVGETAHAAFHKAGHYLGVKVVMLPVDEETFEVDPKQVEAAINENTILLVGSAPSYAHGVIDPIEELGALAKKNGIFCHVDACVGGFYLPFARMAGDEVRPFDFSVKGVTTMSCDFHKYGYAAKGASCILSKNRNLRSYQMFACSAWSGYSLVNPTVLSSKTGGPMAGAWATLNHIGKEGYVEIVKGTQKASKLVLDGIKEIPELRVLGKPVMNLIGIVSDEPSISVFDISDWMAERGWHIQVQFASNGSEEAIHLSINRANVPFIPAMLEDMKKAISELKGQEKEEMQLDPAMLAPMLDALTPETFDNLAQMFGLDGEDGLPSNMGEINGVLNKLPAKHRNKVLIEFMNKLFTVNT